MLFLWCCKYTILHYLVLKRLLILVNTFTCGVDKMVPLLTLLVMYTHRFAASTSCMLCTWAASRCTALGHASVQFHVCPASTSLCLVIASSGAFFLFFFLSFFACHFWHSSSFLLLPCLPHVSFVCSLHCTVSLPVPASILHPPHKPKSLQSAHVC